MSNISRNSIAKDMPKICKYIQSLLFNRYLCTAFIKGGEKHAFLLYKHFYHGRFNKNAMKITSTTVEMFRKGKQGVFCTEQ